ncbi:penicillin-binding protein activator [Rubellimicrobium sp. CFH 75288]|uniref:penicillin-binding protein activator n=1 Tax=Rubellimicrobium sp. CFH 75288 TaxID=2697034 RepID=UPI0014137063|nr:penicillin-binding protein activator [Rubellimicrobium sp. CFH 75288]NAZ36618.1 ABC transporter substrate-binding protein [Rubellimicrobium sp. CFH 75288]
MTASPTTRRLLAGMAALGALALAPACAPLALTEDGPAAPALRPGEPVPVALLVPAGSRQESDNFIARNLENAARLAIADLSGVAVDLRVYATGGQPNRAASAAQTAVQEGAAIILGPLYAEEANAAGVAVAGTGVNVLAFSNNPTIAGGNVFVLGPTFRNTANRLVRYGRRAGIDRYLIVHGNDLQGAVGRDAIRAAAEAVGATVTGVQVYPLTQAAIQAAGPAIVQAAREQGAQAIFTTAGPNADLPILATVLPAAGLPPSEARLVGLTRWDAVPQILSIPGLQGGLFAIPDQDRLRAFESRYAAAYGATPHPLAALAYDGIAAIGALAARRNPQALSRASLIQGQGFEGTAGIFRLLADGTNERGLAVATVQNGQVVILEPAPRSFVGAGS